MSHLSFRIAGNIDSPGREKPADMITYPSIHA
jgi:hypothetical protein